MRPILNIFKFMNSTTTMHEQCCYRCVNSDFYLMKIPKKKSKKIKKIKKHHYRFFSSQNKLGKAEKEKKENNKIK